MAMYDNKHWLLTHIRDSFISTDDTGMCEMLMVPEDIPKQLKANGTRCYPAMEESDDDEDLDAMSESYDIQMDMEFGHRPRSNTAQRLEKMELEKKKASKIKHIKWEVTPVSLSDAEIAELFPRKDFRNKQPKKKIVSLLSEQLDKSPHIPRNPYVDYAQFDGSTQIGVAVRKYRIFMCMLSKEERAYPLQVTVVATAKVQEFIGLICYKYSSEHPNHNLKGDITKYGLYISEDDGEVDWDFPCLDPREVIAKFEFSSLCLVEMRASDRAKHEPTTPILRTTIEVSKESSKTEQEIFAEDLARMKGHTTAMEAPLYQLYRVYIVNKVRAKTEIHLGISGDKIEIDPVITGKGASRFWHRQRAVSYQMENIAWCELIDRKGSKSSFILVSTAQPSLSDTFSVSSLHTNSLQQSMSFKTHDFEADTAIAEEIVRKVNHILELRSTPARKEFIVHRERKLMRRKSFHLHR